THRPRTSYYHGFTSNRDHVRAKCTAPSETRLPELRPKPPTQPPFLVADAPRKGDHFRQGGSSPSPARGAAGTPIHLRPRSSPRPAGIGRSQPRPSCRLIPVRSADHTLGRTADWQVDVSSPTPVCTIAVSGA